LQDVLPSLSARRGRREPQGDGSEAWQYFSRYEQPRTHQPNPSHDRGPRPKVHEEAETATRDAGDKRGYIDGALSHRSNPVLYAAAGNLVLAGVVAVAL